MWFSITQNKALTALVVFFLPITISLGFWQLDRATEKNNLLQAMVDTDQMKEVQADDDLLSLANFQNVTLRGKFAKDVMWLLDNQIWQGKVGVDVIVPVRFGGKSLLVNLGWVQWSDRSTLPTATLTDLTLNLQGRLVYPSQDAFVLEADQRQTSSPRLVQRIDMTTMSTELDAEIWPQILYLSDTSDGVLQSHWQPINMGPEKHYGYAVQWFGLALVLLVLYSYRIYQFGRQRL